MVEQASHVALTLEPGHEPDVHVDHPEAYIARDRRRALAAGHDLPDRVTGSALFADISGFTPLTEALAAAARDGGFHKLIGKLFTDNTASLRLVERCGFSPVGLHLRHGQLDGTWRDVLVVERLLEPAR